MKQKIMALALIANLISFEAIADVQCGGAAGPGTSTPGTVTRLLTYADGSVNVYSTWRNDFTYICNVKTPRLGVDPLVCSLWVSNIESARAINTPVIIYYYTSTFDCTTIPNYSNAPAPAYVGF